MEEEEEASIPLPPLSSAAIEDDLEQLEPRLRTMTTRPPRTPRQLPPPPRRRRTRPGRRKPPGGGPRKKRRSCPRPPATPRGWRRSRPRPSRATPCGRPCLAAGCRRRLALLFLPRVAKAAAEGQRRWTHDGEVEVEVFFFFVFFFVSKFLSVAFSCSCCPIALPLASPVASFPRFLSRFCLGGSVLIVFSTPLAQASSGQAPRAQRERKRKRFEFSQLAIKPIEQDIHQARFPSSPFPSQPQRPSSCLFPYLRIRDTPK